MGGAHGRTICLAAHTKPSSKFWCPRPRLALTRRRNIFPLTGTSKKHLCHLNLRGSTCPICEASGSKTTTLHAHIHIYNHLYIYIYIYISSNIRISFDFHTYIQLTVFAHHASQTLGTLTLCGSVIRQGASSACTAICKRESPEQESTSRPHNGSRTTESP